jgi:hypothetical protein
MRPGRLAGTGRRRPYRSTTLARAPSRAALPRKVCRHQQPRDKRQGEMLSVPQRSWRMPDERQRSATSDRRGPDRPDGQ